MTKGSYSLVTSPGLPPWPKLYIDSNNRKAMCSIRIPTWKSHFLARSLCVYLVWVFVALIITLLWLQLEQFSWVDKLIILIPAGYFLVPVSRYLTFEALPEFLARRLFARRTRFWFTEEAIAFQSQLYSKPVVVWREWRGLPVRSQFIVEQDRDAADFLQKNSHLVETPIRQISESALIELVITIARRDAGLGAAGQEKLLRKLPVVEVNSEQATQLSIVCAAAINLTTTKKFDLSRTGTSLDSDSSKGDS